MWRKSEKLYKISIDQSALALKYKRYPKVELESVWSVNSSDIVDRESIE